MRHSSSKLITSRRDKVYFQRKPYFSERKISNTCILHKQFSLILIHTNAFGKTTNQLVFEKQVLSLNTKKKKTSRRHQRKKQEPTVEKVTHEGEKELTLEQNNCRTAEEKQNL